MLIGIVLIIFQVGLKWFKKYTSEEQKKSTQTQARRVLDNLEVQKIILQKADSLESIQKGYEEISAEIEKLKSIKLDSPDLYDLDFDELGDAYRRSRNEACVRFFEREVRRILSDAETSHDPQIKKIRAEEALKTLSLANHELGEEYRDWLDKKKAEIEAFLY